MYGKMRDAHVYRKYCITHIKDVTSDIFLGNVYCSHGAICPAIDTSHPWSDVTRGVGGVQILLHTKMGTVSHFFC